MVSCKVLRSVKMFGLIALFNLEDAAKEQIEKQRRDGGLAQLGERLPCKQEVSGSIPLISTNKRWRGRDASSLKSEPKEMGQ